MKFRLLLLLAPVLLFAACSENDIITYNNDSVPSLQEPLMTNNTSSSYKVPFSTLLKYLHSKGRKQDSTIKPLIDSGDTLAYYVQYHEGWEIITADKRLLPVIMKSNNGQLDFGNMDKHNAQEIENLLEYLKDFRSSTYDKLNPTWALFEQPKSKNRIRPRGYGEGMWIPQDTIIDETVENSPQIIDTKWGQLYPWNLYTKIIGDQVAPVGCGPLAVGQVIYHYRIKNHRNCQVPTTAKYLNENPIPQYSEFSTDGWSLMEKSVSTSSIFRYAPAFLGYLGKQMNASYAQNETTITLGNINNALTTYKLKYSELSAYNFSKIYSSLKRESPIIICATGYDNANSNTLHHIFLITGYSSEYTNARISYVWDPEHRITEWEYDHYDQSMFNMDPSGNDYREDEVLLSENVYFRINWGFSEAYNNRLYGAAFTTYAFIEDGRIIHEMNKYEVAPYWKINTQTFNTVNKIFYDIQEQY